MTVHSDIIGYDVRIIQVWCSSEAPNIVTANPYPRDFVDRGDAIPMRLEHYDTVRTIHLTALPPDGETPASPLGYSVGRWDNDTLCQRYWR